MKQLVNFDKLVNEETVLYLTTGTAVLIDDEPDNKVWQIYDTDMDTIYLLVNDEVNELKPFIDYNFYQMMADIKNTKCYH